MADVLLWGVTLWLFLYLGAMGLIHLFFRRDRDEDQDSF